MVSVGSESKIASCHFFKSCKLDSQKCYLGIFGQKQVFSFRQILFQRVVGRMSASYCKPLCIKSVAIFDKTATHFYELAKWLVLIYIGATCEAYVNFTLTGKPYYMKWHYLSMYRMTVLHYTIGYSVSGSRFHYDIWTIYVMHPANPL